MRHATQIKLPNLGENIESGDVLSILVREGDTVKANQDLLEVETDKATMPIPSPQAGKITKMLVTRGRHRVRRRADHGNRSGRRRGRNPPRRSRTLQPKKESAKRCREAEEAGAGGEPKSEAKEADVEAGDIPPEKRAASNRKTTRMKSRQPNRRSAAENRADCDKAKKPAAGRR